jgi:orotate phosphoribosyltransferase
MEQKILLILMDLGIGIVVVWLSVVLLEKIYGKKMASFSKQKADWSFINELVTVSLTCSEYQATSGGRIPNYVDTDSLMTNPELLEKAISRMADQLTNYLKKHPSAKVCFIEKDSGPVGMLAYAGLLSTKFKRPISVIRPRREVLKMATEGIPIQAGDKVVLVQDVLKTSFQVVQAAHKIKQMGAQAIAVVALVDRNEEKDSQLSEMGIEVISDVNLSEMSAVKEGNSMKLCEN